LILVKILRPVGSPVSLVSGVMTVPGPLRQFVGTQKARSRAVIAEARAQAVIDRARRHFEAAQADIVDLSEAESWDMAVEWLLAAEKRITIDKTPQELVDEAELGNGTLTRVSQRD
jgi:hypothetical protein